MSRGFVVTAVVVIAGGAALIFFLNRDSDSSSGTGSSQVPTVNLTTSDGVDAALDVTSCDNPGETTISLEATNETADLEMDAAGGSGTIIFDSSDGRREGTVDSVQVGDTGNITASGTLSAADDSAGTATFELTGSCA